jgi:hypothetical protein
MRHFVLPQSTLSVAMMILIGGQRSFTAQQKPSIELGIDSIVVGN